MFERFTERARQVVVLAQDEARGLGHDHIGTEHILLGLLREEEGVAARALENAGVAIEDARAEVERRLGRDDAPTAGQIPFTPAAKEALELALREALKLGNNYIGTEHVLLGILSVPDGPAAAILAELGVESSAVREKVIGVIRGEQGPLPPTMRRYRPRGWQYHVVALTFPITEEVLAPLGKAGWELVTVVGDRAVFKRPA